MRLINGMVLICFLLYTTAVVPRTAWAEQSDEKKTLAVLPLVPSGVSESEANALTNQLQNELVQTNRYIIIERTQVDELLIEQGLGLTGCVTNECVAEAGKLLGAQLMIAGSVDKLGQTYNVVARIVDVETGQVSISRNIIQGGEIDGLLTRMRDLALLLTGETTITEGLQLRVTPTPSDATILIDGQNRGRGNVTVSLPAGSHAVRVIKSGYTPWEQTVNLTQNQTLAANLIPLKFELKINVPGDVIVYIDGQRIGPGSVTRTLPGGTHQVRVTRNGFDQTETVNLTGNQTLKPPIPDLPKTSGSKKWLWGLLGALVAGGAGAGVALGGGGGDNPDPDPDPVTGVSGSPPDPP